MRNLLPGKLFACVLFLLLVATGCRAAAARPVVLAPEPGEELSGGQATVFDTSPNAFSLPVPGLEREQRLLFFVGNSFFNQNWVTAPASTTARDGLGPLFNARSCSGCHFRDDKAEPPVDGQGPFVGLLLRLSEIGRAHV